jgi:predicted AAA+ superfamily ATPase
MLFSEEWGSGREGLAGVRYRTDRKPTVPVLLALLSVRGWIMVKAPPQCVKTTILQLLGLYAQDRGVRVFYVSFADL